MVVAKFDQAVVAMSTRRHQLKSDGFLLLSLFVPVLDPPTLKKYGNGEEDVQQQLP